MKERNVKKVMKALGFILVFTVLLSSCDMLTGLFKGKGTVTGYVYDASTDTPVAGVVVTATGSTGQATTDASGYFAIELSEGEVTLHFTKTGLTFYDVTVTVEKDTTFSVTEDIVGYTPLQSGQYRFVLTWGAAPSDLDSHLYIPGIGEEIYFIDKDASDASANLDWDVTTGYGPETTTISTQRSGTYYYSIYNYSQTGSFSTSNAVVKIYNSSGLWKTYTASSVAGDGTSDWWRVCSLNGTTITAINTFDDTAGTSWAGIE